MFSHLLNKRTPSKEVLEVLETRKTSLLVLVISDTFLKRVAVASLDLSVDQSCWSLTTGVCGFTGFTG